MPDLPKGAKDRDNGRLGPKTTAHHIVRKVCGTTSIWFNGQRKSASRPLHPLTTSGWEDFDVPKPFCTGARERVHWLVDWARSQQYMSLEPGYIGGKILIGFKLPVMKTYIFAETFSNMLPRLLTSMAAVFEHIQSPRCGVLVDLELVAEPRECGKLMDAPFAPFWSPTTGKSVV